jgi:hypothetical protein
MRIESRKGVLSRKSSVNKNSFYKQKAKLPEYLPNKPTVVGSRGASSYFNKGNVLNNNPGAMPNITKDSSHGKPGMGANYNNGAYAN